MCLWSRWDEPSGTSIRREARREAGGAGRCVTPASPVLPAARSEGPGCPPGGRRGPSARLPHSARLCARRRRLRLIRDAHHTPVSVRDHGSRALPPPIEAGAQPPLGRYPTGRRSLTRLALAPAFLATFPVPPPTLPPRPAPLPPSRP